MAIKTRQTTATGVTNNNAPLTNSEVDNNFVELQQNKQDKPSEGAFANGDKTKLDGIESGATADQTANEILTAIKTVDGTGSGLDADTLDGAQPSVSASNSTIVQRHSSGYVFANYFNTTANDVSSGVTKVMVETGNDNYIRHGTAGAIRSFINVENGATADQTASEILTAIKTVDGTGSGLDADLLDGVNSSSFVRSDADDSISGDLNTTAALSYTQGTGIHVLRPQGGMYTTTASSVTGMIRIQLPVFNTNTMMRFEVDIYDYAGDEEGESIKLLLGGYNYNSAWYNTFAHLISGRTDRNFLCRFGHDGTRNVVLIGSASDNWSYPQINVTNFFGGYSGASSGNWADGWGIGFSQSLVGFTITKNSTAKLVATDSEGLGGVTSENWLRSTADDDVSAHTEWQDGKEVRLGSGADMRLQHSGSDSYIDNYTGHLYIRQLASNGRDIYLECDDTAGNPHKVIAGIGSTGNPYARLYYNAIKSLETTSIGVNVYGSSNAQAEIALYGADGDFFGAVNGSEGDYIGFQDGDGSWCYRHQKDSNHEWKINNQQRMYLDNNTLKINTPNNEKISLEGSTDPYIRWCENSTDRAYIQYVSGTNAFRFRNQETGLFDMMSVSNTAINVRYMGSDGDVWGSVYATDSQEIGFLDEGGSWAFRIVNDDRMEFRIGTQEEMRLESDGDLHVEGDVIAFSTTVSDRRLKENIKNIENALDKVDQINGVTFLRKANGQESAGVIAQEIMEVLPEAVKEKALPLLDENSDEKYYVVEYDAVTGLLVEAIKELKSRVEALEAK